MQLLKISHLTRYSYEREVEFLPHRLLIRPRDGHDVRVTASKLVITPGKHRIRWHRDVDDNSVAEVRFFEPARELSFLSEVIIEHYDEKPLDFLIAEPAVNFPFQYDQIEAVMLLPYQRSLFPEDRKQVRAWLSQFWQPGQKTETFVLLDKINSAIPELIKYRMREEPGVQSPATTLKQQSGSCRDMATLFIEICREIGLAARFISGYQHAPVSEAGEGSTHAWSEIYLPGAGWKGFDSTTGKITGTKHISVAVSYHPEAVPPVSGAFLGKLEQPPVMDVKIRVTNITGQTKQK
ncbi:MAG: transglutaminase family protein [Thiolinea sp.]